jgi:SMI1 / KNR4 family (SUKH-1)
MWAVSEPPGNDELARLLEPLDRGDPISEDALRRLTEHVEQTYGASLPDDYLAFLRRANGADGPLPGGNPIVLWEAEQLPDVNADLETEQWMPGFFVIGSDSGDFLYGIDLRPDAPPDPYVETEDAAMEWDYVLWRGGSFLELLRYSRDEN